VLGQEQASPLVQDGRSAVLTDPTARPALVVAHPGHELRVHGWLQHVRPIVYVLTDGSGGGAASRLESTRRILRDLGVPEGAIFGRFTDRALYAAVMAADTALFTALADELAAAFVATDRDVIVCDGREGYNASHDMCWFVVEAAVALASAARARALPCFEFPVVGEPQVHGDGVRVTLTEAALDRKILAALSYPEMAAEVQTALERFTAKAFQAEPFERAVHRVDEVWRAGSPPYYEQYGEQQVAAGIYRSVLRAGDHVAPVVAALRAHVRRRTG